MYGIRQVLREVLVVDAASPLEAPGLSVDYAVVADLGDWRLSSGVVCYAKWLEEPTLIGLGGSQFGYLVDAKD